jgi:acyl carrier protein
MTKPPSQVTEKVCEIVSALFSLPSDTVTVSTSHNDAKAWDSIGHLNLVLALQEEFSIHVPPEDFEKLNNVGAIINYLIASTSKQR